MAHPIPAPRTNPWSLASVRLVRALIRTAWTHGYSAVPRDGSHTPAVILTPRSETLRPGRSGRLYLAPHEEADAWWHWSDTGQPLATPPDDERVIAEITRNLTGGPR